MERLSEIFNLADQILNSSEDPEELMERLSQYSDKVEDFVAWINSSTGVKPPKGDLERLAALHDQVLSVTDQFRDDTSSELQDLQRKGKGIRAYLDQFPVPHNKASRKKT